MVGEDFPVYTVSQLTQELSRALQTSFGLVWVRGEVSNFRCSHNGHWYFDLKEAGHLVRAVMFSTVNRFHPTLCDGLHVMALGSIDYYGPWGATQLYCSEIHTLGTGDEAAALAELRARLEAQGVFEPSRKRQAPRFPKRVGIVTSPQGAALWDVIKVVEQRFPLAEVVLAPAAVQGDDASFQIVQALRAVNAFAKPDVVLLVRGGGSSEDLAAFNTEEVAREVFASQAPVVTGVGHSTDLSLADLAADVVAITPTQAAHSAIPSVLQLREEIASLENRATVAALGHIRRHRERIEPTLAAVARQNPARQLQEVRSTVDRLAKRAETEVWLRLHRLRTGVARLEATAAGARPSLALNRGFAVLRSLPLGVYVSSIDTVSPDDELQILLRDGVVSAQVRGVKRGEPRFGF